MGAIVSVGGAVPVSARSGHLDLVPLVTVLLALVVVRLMLGIQLRWFVVLGVTIGGTFLAGAIEAWGVALPAAFALALGVVASWVLHREARRGDAPA